MSFVNWLRGVKAKVDIEPVEDGNVILQDNGDGTADLFVDKGNQRLHVIDSTQTSGGHTIWNAIKTALTQRTKLWFADAKVTDDSTEQATKVEVVQLIDSESELTNAPDGVYQGDYDDAPEDVLDASMVAYGSGSVEDALDNVAYTNVYNSFTQNQGINRADGTSSTVGNSDFYLGNATASGTDGNSRGRIIIYGGGTKYTILETVVSGTNKLIEFPNASGTVALTSDITDVTSYAFTPSENSQIVESSINKVGRIVDCHLVLQILSSTSGSSIQLGTIPTGARPLANQSQVVTIGDGILVTITIATNGVVYCYANKSALNWTMRIQSTYISAT